MEDAIRDLLEKLEDSNATIFLAKERIEEISDNYLSSWDDDIESQLLSLLVGHLENTVSAATLLLKFYEDQK